MTMSKPHIYSPERGSALVFILIAVALFAALSFAISQQSDSGKSLLTEKTNLLASDVMDMGNRMTESVAKLRLHGVQIEQVSFQNDIVTGYTNAACNTDKCKIFDYDGGERDWEKPTTDISNGVNWGYTGDLSINQVGTASADLIAILPNISLVLCNRLNKMVGITNDPPQFNGVAADKYVGAFAVAPINLSDPIINGKTAACIELTTPSGTALTGITASPIYAYYQVLSVR
jgi:hypothetical protein